MAAVLSGNDALRVPVIARPSDDTSIAPRLDRIWETRKGFLGALSSVDHKTIGKRYLVTAFVFLLIRSTMGRFTPAQATAAIVVSYYWHFVDVVWVGLFATIYLIR